MLWKWLRGLSFASGNNSTYTVLFEWLMSPWKKINGSTRVRGPVDYYLMPFYIDMKHVVKYFLCDARTLTTRG